MSTPPEEGRAAGEAPAAEGDDQKHPAGTGTTGAGAPVKNGSDGDLVAGPPARSDAAERAATAARAAAERAAAAARAAASRALAARAAGAPPAAAPPAATPPGAGPSTAGPDQPGPGPATVDRAGQDVPVPHGPPADVRPPPVEDEPAEPEPAVEGESAEPEPPAAGSRPPTLVPTPAVPVADVSPAGPTAAATSPDTTAVAEAPSPPPAAEPRLAAHDVPPKAPPVPPPAGRTGTAAGAGAAMTPTGTKARPVAAPATGPAPGATRGKSRGGREAPRWLAFAGLIVAAWAALPHFLTPPLDTEDLVEIVDHVVPGLVVFAVCVGAAVVQRRPGGGGNYLFVGGLVLVLAGLWMVATHLPLVAQATRQEAPWAGTIYHSASALSVFGFSLIWMAANWNAPDFSEG